MQVVCSARTKIRQFTMAMVRTSIYSSFKGHKKLDTYATLDFRFVCCMTAISEELQKELYLGFVCEIPLCLTTWDNRRPVVSEYGFKFTKLGNQMGTFTIKPPASQNNVD